MRRSVICPVSLPASIERLRQPEYTGENRCLPCTVVNLGFALVTSVGLAVGVVAIGVPLTGAVLVAGITLLGALALVYLRGYVVPGTPTLTRRYMPRRLLQAFGKAPDPPRDERGSVEIEDLLVEAGAVEECPDRNDLCLRESFEEAWWGRIDADEVSEEDVLELFDEDEIDALPARELTVESRDDAYVAYVDETLIAQWESHAAWVADMTAAAELRERYPGWDELDFPERTEVAGSLRLWLTRCPDCRAPVTMDEETVESCCWQRRALAATCEGCESRLFEAGIESDALQASS